MRKLIIFFALVVLSAHPILAAQNDQQTRLILVISIDQMRYDYLTRFGSLFEGGFKTLLSKGAVFTNAHYRHASTETGPGHAVIMSGRHGSHSGIIANEWYDSYLKKTVNVVDDEVQHAVGDEGRAASPAHFIGFTLGDALKAVHPNTRVFGVSTKDRAAVLMSGKKSDGAFWFESGNGSIITSSYYMQEAPNWLKAFNAQHFTDQFIGKNWERLKDNALYEKFAGPDAAEGEYDGKDIVFPHYINNRDSFMRTPFIDELTLEVAKRVRTNYHLGENDSRDLLTISFSATDFIGHRFGPDSQELMDQMLRLDRTLQKLFDEVDAQVGLAHTLVVLTADHGVQPLVEHLVKNKIPAKRVNADTLKNTVETALLKRFPKASGLIASSDAPSFWLDKEKIRAQGIKLSEVEDTIIDTLRASGNVAAAYRASDFLKDAPQNDPYFELHRNSFFASRSPDIIGRPNEYTYIGSYLGGTGHGTPYEYDRHVPIIFMGPKIVAGSYDEACGPEDIAPTLASILGITYPKEDDARLLNEMIR